MYAPMASSPRRSGLLLGRACLVTMLLCLTVEPPCCEAVRMMHNRTAERVMANRTGGSRNLTAAVSVGAPQNLTATIPLAKQHNLTIPPAPPSVVVVEGTPSASSDESRRVERHTRQHTIPLGSASALPVGEKLAAEAKVVNIALPNTDLETVATVVGVSVAEATDRRPATVEKLKEDGRARPGSALQQAGSVAASISAMKDASADPINHFTNNPDELIPLIFSVLCFLAFISMVVFHGDPQAQVAKIRRQKEKMSKAYHTTIGEMHGLLNNMNESSACFAQRNFNAKRRTFQRFLEKMKKGPKHYQQPKFALLPPFREFVHHFITIWQQCTIDPIHDPRVIVKWEELQACETVAQVAELVEHRLESAVEIVAERMDQFELNVAKNAVAEERPDEHSSWIGFGCVGFGLRFPQPDDNERLDGPRERTVSCAYEDDDEEQRYPVDILFGLMRMTLLSESHARFVFGLLWGGAIIGLELYLNKTTWALIVACGEVCLLIIVFGFQEFDQIAQLTKAIGQLHKERRMLEEQRNQMVDFYSKLQMVTSLWLYRTVPRLDNMLELTEQFLDTPEHLRLALLEGLTTRLKRLEKAMGPLEMYCGSLCGRQSLPEDKLILAAEQLNDCTHFIDHLQATDRFEDVETIPQILFRMERVFAFVYVRIMGAHNLTNKNYEFALIGHKSHPYVTLQMESTGAPPPRTATVENNLNPTWDNEEFFFPSQPLDSKLELHVWNANEVADHSSLGYVRVDFRKLEAGVWHKRKDKLMSLRKGHQKESELEYEIYFADELAQLIDVDSAKHLEEDNAQRLSVFIKK